MKGLRLLKPGHGSVQVELDPGLKMLEKNGKATVFVDQTIWQSAETCEAAKDRAHVLSETVKHLQSERTKDIMTLGNKTSDCLTLEALADSLRAQLDSWRTWAFGAFLLAAALAVTAGFLAWRLGL